MKTIAIVAAAAALIASPALAQQPAAEHANHSAAAGALDVQKTKISEIIKNEKAKAALEKALPPISQFYDQIGEMTLAEVAPMSQGAIDDAKLKEIQTEFDKLK
jgi:hypothetical protein